MCDNTIFAEHFPNGCPPSDAFPASGTMYRLVSHNPPTEDDLATFAELGKAQNGDECLRCGLSVFATQDDAADLYRFIARRYGTNGTRIGSLVARFDLQPEHGQLKPTPNRRSSNSHHTWWPYAISDRASAFCAVAQDASDALAN